MRPSIFQSNTLNIASGGEQKAVDIVTENKNNPFLKFCDNEDENNKAIDSKATAENEEVIFHLL